MADRFNEFIKDSKSSLEDTNFYKSGGFEQTMLGLSGAGMAFGLEHMQNPYGTVNVGFNPMNFVPYALGGPGNGPIEAEGGEVKEFANGDVEEYFGPSHNKGGIKDLLSPGDVIYSKRIKIGGKSLAKRKIERTKKISRLEKALANGYSREKENSLNRMNEAFSLEDKKDLSYQKKINEIKMIDGTHPLLTGKGNKMAFGTYDPISNLPWELTNNKLGVPGGEFPDLSLLDLEDDGTGFGSYGKPNNVMKHLNHQKSKFNTQINRPNINVQPLLSNNKTIGLAKANPPVIHKSNNPTEFNYDHLGDFGTAFNGITPLINTLKNSRKNKPNINPNFNVNKDAIKSIDKIENNLDYQFDQNKLDNRRSLAASDIIMKNNSRGINSTRSNLSLNQARFNKQNAKSKSEYLNRLNQVLSQRSNLEAQRSQILARGEYQRDIADRQDRDNVNTQLAENLGNFGYSMQQFAHGKNAQKNQDMVMDAYERYKAGSISIQEYENVLRVLSNSMNIQYQNPTSKVKKKKNNKN